MSVNFRRMSNRELAEEAVADLYLDVEHELERFLYGLLDDQIIEDTVPVRFEVWARLQKLASRLEGKFKNEILNTAESIAEDWDMDESKQIISDLRGVLSDFEEEIKGTRGRRRDSLKRLAAELKAIIRGR